MTQLGLNIFGIFSKKKLNFEFFKAE